MFAVVLLASVGFGRKVWPVMELVLVPPASLLLWWVAEAGGGRRARVAVALLGATLVLLVGAAVTDSAVVHDEADASTVEFGRPFPWISQDVRPLLVDDLPARVQPFAFGSIDQPGVSYRALVASAGVALLVVASLGAGGYLVRRRLVGD